MISFFILFCWFISFALKGMNMYDYRLIGVFYLCKGFDKAFYIVSIFYIIIIIAH